MTTSIRVAVDFTGVEKADDGDTTRFGGSYVLDGVTRPSRGDDRGDNYVWETIEYITNKCNAMWGGVDEVDSDDLLDAIEALDAGFIVVTLDNEKFTVTAEA